MDSWTRRRAKLAKEKKWVDAYVHCLPEVQAADLVRGVAYHAVTYHEEDCWLYRGGRCCCRPVVKFYAEPMRQ
jgi:hypothetical protein